MLWVDHLQNQEKITLRLIWPWSRQVANVNNVKCQTPWTPCRPNKNQTMKLICNQNCTLILTHHVLEMSCCLWHIPEFSVSLQINESLAVFALWQPRKTSVKAILVSCDLKDQLWLYLVWKCENGQSLFSLRRFPSILAVV